MLKLENYSSKILSNISLYIENKNLIVLGANGAGKTTLAKVLSGVIESDDIEFETPRTKFVNYIPSSLEIFDDFLNVREFLQLSHLHGVKTIDEVLHLLQIEHLKDKSSKNLSSGESQLLLIASSILHGAKYTILDEPTSNLDPKKVKMVYEVLKDENLLQNRIVITHNLHLAYKLGFDVVYIEDGKINFQGTSEQFFSSDNLHKVFDGSVKNIDENIVTDL